MVQEELKDIYEDSVIYVRYPGVPWGTLGYPLWCVIYDILRYQSWNISDCRKMVVITHFSTFWNIWTIEVLLPQWFKKNWKISVKTVLFMQDMKYFQSLKYFSIIEIFFDHWNIFQSLKYFQSWDIWTIVVWSMISWDIWTNEVWSMISQDILRLILIYV